jgi:hypothetical protein
MYFVFEYPKVVRLEILDMALVICVVALVVTTCCYCFTWLLVASVLAVMPLPPLRWTYGPIASRGSLWHSQSFESTHRPSGTSRAAHISARDHVDTLYGSREQQ